MRNWDRNQTPQSLDHLCGAARSFPWTTVLAVFSSVGAAVSARAGIFGLHCRSPGAVSLSQSQVEVL